MKYQSVTVQHPLIEPEDDEAIDEFERLLDEGTHEWTNRNRLTAEEVSQQICETLLGRLQWRAASLITPEAIRKIHDSGDASEGAALVKGICGEISTFLKLDLISMSGIPLRGRRREFSDRDRQICEMRRCGLSYGKIGDTLGISRNAVQAAYRRERQRRESLCRDYPDLQEFFGAFGIILEAAKPAN
jgi:DNA-binding NarL/FixJ family response regulator